MVSAVDSSMFIDHSFFCIWFVDINRFRDGSAADGETK